MIKKLIILAAAFGAFSLGCKRPSGGTPTTEVVYRGIVLHAVCCQDVISTIGTDLLGQEDWVDSNSTVPALYHHVFKVANPCQFGVHKEGDTVNFCIVPQQQQTCACCMIYIFTPHTSYPIQVIN